MLQINQPLHKLSIKLVVPFLFCMPYLYQILMVISIYKALRWQKKLAVSLKWHANSATYHQPLHKLAIKLVVPFLFCMPYLYHILMVISIYIRHYDGKKMAVSLKWHANGTTYHQPLHKLPIKLVVPFLFCMPYLYQILMVISIYIRHYDGKKLAVSLKWHANGAT